MLGVLGERGLLAPSRACRFLVLIVQIGENAHFGVLLIDLDAKTAHLFDSLARTDPEVAQKIFRGADLVASTVIGQVCKPTWYVAQEEQSLA
jgi:hypothetical protein